MSSCSTQQCCGLGLYLHTLQLSPLWFTACSYWAGVSENSKKGVGFGGGIWLIVRFPQWFSTHTLFRLYIIATEYHLQREQKDILMLQPHTMLKTKELISVRVTFCYPERQKLEVFLEVQPLIAGRQCWCWAPPPPAASHSCCLHVSEEPTSSKTGSSLNILYIYRALPWADFSALTESLLHTEFTPTWSKERRERGWEHGGAAFASPLSNTGRNPAAYWPQGFCPVTRATRADLFHFVQE